MILEMRDYERARGSLMLRIVLLAPFAYFMQGWIGCFMLHCCPSLFSSLWNPFRGVCVRLGDGAVFCTEPVVGLG